MEASFKKFYTSVGLWEKNGAFGISLDGKPAKTPARALLKVMHLPLAEAIAEEWRTQGDRVFPQTLFFTKAVSTITDTFPERRSHLIADLLAFVDTDLLCYRVLSPRELVKLQEALWDPPLQWASSKFDGVFAVTTGVTPVKQPEALRDAIASELEHLSPFALFALHVLTTLSGSLILAFSVLYGFLKEETAWQAATLEECWQRKVWGQDKEAQEREESRKEEFLKAVRLLHLVGSLSEL